ncbi:MAG: BatA domain-containing protein, partial [Planctomycetaceae bacterium]|nr:BatA domain-containing protein [Planctomycetaceae bacterium]
MIFAFGFGNPLLLWGLALGGLPILIHLLHRRRYRETTWAAMRFLQQAIRSSSRRIRLEHLLLLIVRTLIVLLVVLALARPYAESFARFFGTEQPAHHIIVIDDSLSMSYRHEGETRFDRAREMARRIVSSAPQGHAFNLIRLTGSGPRSVISRPSWQKNEVLREIDRLEQAWGQAELAPTLEEISRAVQQLPEMRRRQVYLISDLQRSTWWPDVAAQREELRSRLARLAEGSTLSVLDTGTALSPNLAVKELLVEQQLISVGQPVLIRTVITSSGPTAPASGTVELVAGGRVTQSRTISFDAERETVAEFTHTFTEGGEQVLEVRLPEDLLPADNTRRIVLPVHDRFRVLLVNGVPAGLPQRQATWYLSNALQSENEPGATGSRLELQTVPDAELSRTSLNQYDCVLLSNVAVLTSRETDMLRAFAEAGGGIGIFPGNRILTQRWNETVFQPENPLIPVRFDGRVGNARNPSTTWSFDTNDLSHPIVAPFQESPGTGLESTLIWEYLKIVPLPDAAVSTVLPLSSGDPAIVEAEVGEGRIILFATSADDQWSTWTTLGGGAFVPMVRETVQRLLTGRGGTRQLTVGQPLLHALAT